MSANLNIYLNKIAIVFAIFISTICVAIGSNLPLMQFEHYTTENGLSQSSVRCIVQDYKGYIWIGTQMGVNRFDGVTFKIYNDFKKDSLSKSNNIITDMYESFDQILWVAGAEYISFYERAIDKFIPVDLSFIEKIEQQPISLVNALMEINQSLYAIVSCGNHLYLIKRKGISTLFELVENVPLINRTTYYPGGISVDNDNNIWFGTFASGLYKLSSSGNLKRYYAESQNTRGLSSDFIRDITTDNNGNIWISAYNSGICLYNKESDDFKQYKSIQDKGFLMGNIINTIFCDSKDRIWLGGDKGGIDIYDTKADTFYHVNQEPNSKYNLNNGSVWSIFEDRNGAIWIGTYGGGINYLSLQKKKFIHYSAAPLSKNWLTDNVVKCMVEDQNGLIWIGTDGKGIHVFNKEKNIFQIIQAHSNGLSSNVIKSLYVDDNNNIWIGTKNGTLDIYNQKSKSFQHIPIIPNSNKGLTYNEINCVNSVDNITFWIGCDAGLNKYNKKTGIFSQYYKTDTVGSISNHYIRNIYIDTENQIWIATNKGINLYNEKGDNFFNKTNNPNNYKILKELGDEAINQITQDSKGNFWAGGLISSLVQFDKEAYSVKNINKPPDLLNIVPIGILEDEKREYMVFVKNRFE